MLGLSLVVGFQLTVRLAQRDAGIDRDVSGNACLVAVLVGVLGARLLYVAVNPEIMEDTGGSWWSVQAGGLMGLGGLVAGFLAAFVYLRIKHVSVMRVADAAMPGLAVGVVLTRLGSYLYGSDFGIRLGDGAPAFLKALGTFPHWQDSTLFGAPAFAYHVERYGLARDAAASYPVHPVQLYEASFGLLLLGLAVFLRRLDGVVPGRRFLRFVGVYGLGAFLLSYLRDDPDRGVLFDFTATQLIVMLVLPLCLIVHNQLGRTVTPRSDDSVAEPRA